MINFKGSGRLSMKKLASYTIGTIKIIMEGFTLSGFILYRNVLSLLDFMISMGKSTFITKLALFVELPVLTDL